MNQTRQSWGQHMYWTRFFIISTTAVLDDLKPVTKRLLQNSKDFAELLTPIFGIRAASRFEELFTQHLLIAADLVNAAKNGEINKANTARDRWYKNADKIAKFLSSNLITRGFGHTEEQLLRQLLLSCAMIVLCHLFGFPCFLKPQSGSAYRLPEGSPRTVLPTGSEYPREQIHRKDPAGALQSAQRRTG